jgi:hypothetical protein
MALDRFAPDVQNFNKWLEDKIEAKRNGLERPDKDAVQTAFLRGHIKAVREVLAYINGDHEENDPDS